MYVNYNNKLNRLPRWKLNVTALMPNTRTGNIKCRKFLNPAEAS